MIIKNKCIRFSTISGCKRRTVSVYLFTWVFPSFLRVVQSYQCAQRHISTVSYRIQLQYRFLNLICDWIITLIAGLERGLFLTYLPYCRFFKLTLHERTECMEKTVYGNVAEFSLGSYSSRNCVIKKLFIAIPAHQRLGRQRRFFRKSWNQ